MITIPINREDLLYDIKDEISRVLEIPFFDVEELSDIDLDMITDSINGMVKNYALALAGRQLQNDAIYEKMIPSAQEEIQKIKKEQYEQSREQNRERERRTIEQCRNRARHQLKLNFQNQMNRDKYLQA